MTCVHGLRPGQRAVAPQLVAAWRQIAGPARLASPVPGRQPQGRGCGRRTCLRVRAIGFDLTGDAPTRSVERRAEELCTAAASLLLFRSVLDASPAKAFIKVLAALQRKSLPDVLAAYGEFYGEMAASRSASWQDLLLDELLSGRGNAWAKAAANDEANPAMLAAVQHDLEVLQRLAVGERALTDWVGEAHPSAPQAWLAAASGPAPALQEADWPAQLPAPGALLQEWGWEPEPGPAGTAPDIIQAPPSLAQLKEWRARISSERQWSAAAGELQAFFRRHGHGLTQRYSVLEYKGGALQAYVPFQPGSSWLGCDPGLAQQLRAPGPCADARQAVLRMAGGHLDGSKREEDHLFYGADSKAELWGTLVSAPNLVLGRRGLRVVLCSAGGGSEQLLGLARALAQYRRVRFLVAPVLDAQGRPGTPQELGHADVSLPPEVRGVWPANALLSEARIIRVGEP